MKRKSMFTALILCMGILCIPLNGCGKKKDESTAIAITPTPSEKSSKDESAETPSPTVSADSASAISGNVTATPAVGVSANSGISANMAGTSNKITGTIVAASMEDVTVRTSEGMEYICSTAGAANNLTKGITLGNNITVTLASMSAVNGVYTATELNDISSASQTGTSVGTDGLGTAESGTDTDYGTDGTGTDTYEYDETYDDGYSDYSGDYSYDDGSGDYYYYDPASEVYDDSYSY